ncbi:MAG: GMC family oxidoreductase [Deltaproteobacteria bacterium]|nr:GMC family oxidoreductase [Deltaproteobacteria bacterium]
MSLHAGRMQRGPLTLDCDTVIVGSGAGGAPVAATLAESGERVVILEEGPHVSGEQHGQMRPSQSVRHVWRDGALTLAVGLGDSPSVNVTAARMVGGSSAVTGGVCFRAPEAVLSQWAKDLRIDDLQPNAMARWFDQVAKDIHIEEVPANMRSKSTQLFIEGGAREGISFEPMSRNTHQCNGCGRCNFGCPHNAKLSVDRTYLPRAIAAGAELLSDCMVDRIVTDRGRAIGVSGVALNGPYGQRGDAVHVRAKRVVVAAGAMYTPMLLQRSGIGRGSRALGRNLTVHPSFRVMARFDQPVRGWEGALQSAYSKHYEPDGMVLNSVFVPSGVLAATMPGFAQAHAKFRNQIDHLAMFGGMLHDDGGGRVHRLPFSREPAMTYRMSPRDRARIPVLLDRMAKIFFAAGAREVFLPVFGLDPVDADALGRIDWSRIHGRQFECSSQHPLGTCHMGSSPDHSVIDPTGSVWDVPNVFVADGSILPTSLGVNPQWTIMAMALRVAHRLVRA